MTDASRSSSRPEFWDVRYEREDHLFGTGPSAFVASQANRLKPNSEVVELGAGEGRTLVWLAQEGHDVTALDFSGTALTEARALAAARGVDLQTLQSDVRDWTPQRQWDAVVVTFVHLLDHERPDLYRRMREAVRPGGWIIGEWFRPDHLSDGYARIGPSALDRMVSLDELRTHFADDDVVLCDARDVVLDEGEFLSGKAAVTHLAAQRR